MLRFLACCLVLAALSAHAWAADKQTVSIAYLEYDQDTRYSAQRLEARYRLQPWGRPFAGAELGLKDTRFPLMSAQVKLELNHWLEASVADLVKTVQQQAAQGTQFFITDLPDDVLAEVAKQTQELPIMLFNVSALGSALRGQQCQPHLLHVVPSWDMLMDALAQYLVSQKWREVLVLAGETPADKTLKQDFLNSAKRFGLKIVDERVFTLGRDPRQRTQNNIALLTSKADYDVVFVADANGEFARYVPYQTLLPRPVVGSNGLVPDWWFWSWERHGAPQVNNRFVKYNQRLMTGYDWAAWLAVKILSEAILRTNSTDFKTLSDYIRSDEIVIDGVKGASQTFRAWNNQLRQPLFVTSGDAVVARLPLEGFLHPVNNLDTLGVEAKQSQCAFAH